MKTEYPNDHVRQVRGNRAKKQLRDSNARIMRRRKPKQSEDGK